MCFEFPFRSQLSARLGPSPARILLQANVSVYGGEALEISGMRGRRTSEMSLEFQRDFLTGPRADVEVNSFEGQLAHCTPALYHSNSFVEKSGAAILVEDRDLKAKGRTGMNLIWLPVTDFQREDLRFIRNGDSTARFEPRWREGAIGV